MDADTIIVLNNGRIENMGPHEQLMQESEIYRDIYEQQMKGIEAGQADETEEAQKGGDAQ